MNPSDINMTGHNLMWMGMCKEEGGLGMLDFNIPNTLFPQKVSCC